MITKQIGSTRRGLNEWLWQRLSAVYIGAFAVFMIGRLVLCPVESFAEWRDWLSSGYLRIAFSLFFASLLIHAWVGMRSVLLDYVKCAYIRFALLTAIALGLLAIGVWSAEFILELA